MTSFSASILMTNNRDALHSRVRDELSRFTKWLSQEKVRGLIGEAGWPDDLHGNHESCKPKRLCRDEQALWNDLAEVWFKDADGAGLWVTIWATGEWWGRDYSLAAYEATQDDAPVSMVNTQASVIERHLGLHQTLQSQPGGSNLLRPGYIAVIRAEENQVDANQLWVVDDRLRYGSNVSSSQPFKQFPHIVFRIEKQAKRDDLDALTSIAEPRREMVKSLAKGDKDSAKGYKIAAQLATLLSPDLTTDDKKIVFNQLQKEFDEPPIFERLVVEGEATPQLSLGWAMKNAVVEDLEALRLPATEEFLRAELGGEQEAVGRGRDYVEINSPIRDADDIPKQEETPNLNDDIFADSEDESGLDIEGIGDESFALRAASSTSWRVAKSLLVFRDQVNSKAPHRRKDSDGTIGDAAHQSRVSDHNPWVRDGGIGVVTAMDITHDPNNGCDANVIAEALRSSREARVKYIIFNRRIANSSPIGGARAWEWRPYVGPKKNPHTKHIHVSVKSDKGSYDSTAPWPI